MLEPKSDPKEMMEGMEEFLFRSGTMNFGKKKDPKEHLRLGFCEKESMNRKNLDINLQIQIQKIIEETGIHPKDRIVETAEEKIERLKREREEAHAAAMRNRVYIPMYHFPTQAAVYKVENCINKSHQRRVRSKGLQDIIDDDNRISQQKMRDIKKIAQNIDKVATIEANLES